MADPPTRDFSRRAERSRSDVRSRNASRTGTRSIPVGWVVPCSRSSPSRPAAAWTAASRSATRAARSATSSPSGTTWSGATTGKPPSSVSTPPTTSRSSPGGCARRPARRPACSGSTRTRSPSRTSRSRSSTRPGTAATCVPSRRSGSRAARWRSSAPGPAGLAAAQQLTRAGHTVAVYERADKIGGLLRYGIPEFKMEKKHLDKRIDQMRREGTIFRAGVSVGDDDLTADRLARAL